MPRFASIAERQTRNRTGRAGLQGRMLLPLLLLIRADEVQSHVFDHEAILGTSLHLELSGEPRVAEAAHAAVLAEIERLSKLFSSYDPQSELSQLKPPCAATPVSKDLFALLSESERWHRESAGAFHPGVEALTRLWRSAQQAGKLPEESERLKIVEQLKAPLWTLDPSRSTLRVDSALPLCFDAIAKGWIVDAALASAEQAGARDIVLEIGGDLRVSGSQSRKIAVTDPRKPADNAAPLCELELRSAAIATSGGYARGFDLAGRHYSHILDPRTGLPVEAVLQASVVAPDARTADALATILNVLTPVEGLALIAKQKNCAALVIDAAGKQHASPGWAALVQPGDASTQSLRLPNGAEWLLEFELAAPAAGTQERRGPPEGERGGERGRGGRGGRGGGGGYRRPYVAAWIEDESGKPVRTLCLWVQKPRWIPDLRRWNKLYSGSTEKASAVTRATRAPGSYQLAWDGKDDSGAPVELAKGKWTVRLEVVREHGGYQYLSCGFECGASAFTQALTGEGSEVAKAQLRYTLPGK